MAALEARGIEVDADAFSADVEGINEMRDGIPVLTRVRVHYRLPVPADKQEAAERALGRHVEKCPTARSLKGAVEIEVEADFSA